MANTSLSLGEHWESFIRSEVGSGRYGSASEVVRDALRVLEEHKARLDALRVHLSEGAKQARDGVFIEDYSADRLIAALDDEA
jgi:antitoxin ParD1/3/4